MFPIEYVCVVTQSRVSRFIITSIMIPNVCYVVYACVPSVHGVVMAVPMHGALVLLHYSLCEYVNCVIWERGMYNCL